jgi:hypothetical protein
VADTISFIDGDLYLSAAVDTQYLFALDIDAAPPLPINFPVFVNISRVGLLLTGLDPNRDGSTGGIRVDVDIAPVPLPASGLLLASVLGFLGARKIRRRGTNTTA